MILLKIFGAFEVCFPHHFLPFKFFLLWSVCCRFQATLSIIQSLLFKNNVVQWIVDGPCSSSSVFAASPNLK